MDGIVIATLITEAGKLISEAIRANQTKIVPPKIKWPEIPDQLPGFEDKPIGSGSGGGNTRLISSEVKVLQTPAPVPQPQQTEEDEAAVDEQPKGEKVATSCVGCAIGHLATCAGLLKEAVRFAPQGMDEPHVIKNLNICLDELNAMERVDLEPSKIIELPEWERELAHKALACSREVRHFIEAGVNSIDQLEKLAAYLIKTREEIGSAWLQKKLRALSKEDKAEIQRRVMAKLQQFGE